ncbi:4-hydroxy-tetrahydrodipicolinate reductase [Prochlorococcus marinus]|uniref:4-hydroxy-tetrahydrodipicolinate reductase n=1 Tax=Prochlorococcus marinus XMU1408 TaxID=2213228 RepID=A0A318R1G1_PROMR|nr:4-hydroxy-tetrahydrodipicolinate reductase [Prochlorococcus marinus]MBW3042009.1 4-hydroxy-tetrahydrodipicolinate reductase [Prochlorococcus marinus str. XMU1408]PYE03297.1 4-hydroxy-tetrahydrodipicolinate reductase [Prochlorococcus marinus XMU1408]
MSSDNQPIPVLVAGALGRMGSEVVRAINSSDEYQLVGAIDNQKDKEGQDIGSLIGLDPLDVYISSDFEGSLCSASQNVPKDGTNNGAVLVDFTHPKVAYNHTRTAIAYGVHPVIGTTGITSEQLDDLSKFAEKACLGSAIIPNFSVGMVLLQQAASAAARFYEFAELTEMHHNRKADAPSGTCIKTAELIEEQRSSFNKPLVNEEEFIKGSRGGCRSSGLRLHSIRLPGLVAHQKVMFGSNGETFELSHNTIDRSAYMPGVLLVVKKIRLFNKLVYGLEKIL